MPKRQPPKNKTWVQLTQDFVKEWPEVLEGLQFQNMPVKYLLYIDIILKNNLTIHYDIAKELKTKKQETIARFLRKTIEENYLKIKSVDIVDRAYSFTSSPASPITYILVPSGLNLMALGTVS